MGVIICIHVDMIPLKSIGYVVLSIDISRDYWSKKKLTKKSHPSFWVHRLSLPLSKIKKQKIC